MAKNSVTYTVKLILPQGVVSRKGELVSLDDLGATIKYKRYGSSKHNLQSIPIARILSVSGVPGDTDAVVDYLSDNMVYEKLKGQITSRGKVLWTLSTEDGNVEFNPNLAEIICENVDDEEASSKKSKAKSDKRDAARKKKK